MKKREHRRKIFALKYKLFILITILSIVLCRRKDELKEATDALEKGDYPKAVTLLTKVLNKDSLNPEVHYNLSLAYAHLDSVNMSFYHYQKLLTSESGLKDDIQLKEMLAHLLHLEPYVSSLIPMKGLNQFKGTFSPDAQTVAVAAAKRGIADIYLITLDGTIIKKITKGGMDTDPDFSPTGERIVFVSDRDGDEELYFYNLINQQIEKLTDNTAQDFSPSFSPDGEEIVFVSNMDDRHKWEIYKINVTTKKIRRLTRNDYWDGFPKFSSDGKSIVFSSKRNGSEDIYIMKKNGSGESVLFASPTDDNDPQLIKENLFFKSNRDGEWEIYRYNIRNKSLIRLTFNPYPDWNPRISKDGTKMLIARRRRKKWQLYWINMNELISAEFIAAKIKAKRESNK